MGGTDKIRALTDRGDDSPEGELTDGIIDHIAKFERAKTAERSRRGKLRKAREGKNLRSAVPPFGFRYDEVGHELIVNESEMLIVEKVFRIAAQGLGTWAIQARLHSTGVPAPKGGRVWDIMVIKRMATSDIYLPHSYDEMIRLVSPEAATRLEPGREYGIRWHNRLRIANRTVSEPDGNGGRRYRKRSTTTLRPKEEWIAVPAPTHLPRSLVEQARQDSRRFRAPRGSTWRGSMGA